MSTEGINLAHLSEEERAKVLGVLNRDEDIRKRDQDRVRKLKTDVKRLRLKGVLKDGQDANKTCARCRQSFGWFFNKGALCVQCQHRVCDKCRENLDGDQWLCCLCYKQMELDAMSGNWFYSKFRKSKRSKRTNQVVSGNDIVRTSFKHVSPGTIVAGNSITEEVKRALANNNAPPRSPVSGSGSSVMGIPSPVRSQSRENDKSAFPQDDDKQMLMDLLRPRRATHNGPIIEEQHVEVKRISTQRYKDSDSSSDEDVVPLSSRDESMLTRSDSMRSSTRTVSSDGRITIVTDMGGVSDMDVASMGPPSPSLSPYLTKRAITVGSSPTSERYPPAGRTQENAYGAKPHEASRRMRNGSPSSSSGDYAMDEATSQGFRQIPMSHRSRTPSPDPTSSRSKGRTTPNGHDPHPISTTTTNSSVHVPSNDTSTTFPPSTDSHSTPPPSQDLRGPPLTTPVAVVAMETNPDAMHAASSSHRQSQQQALLTNLNSLQDANIGDESSKRCGGANVLNAYPDSPSPSSLSPPPYPESSPSVRARVDTILAKHNKPNYSTNGDAGDGSDRIDGDGAVSEDASPHIETAYNIPGNGAVAVVPMDQSGLHDMHRNSLPISGSHVLSTTSKSNGEAWNPNHQLSYSTAPIPDRPPPPYHFSHPNTDTMVIDVNGPDGKPLRNVHFGEYFNREHSYPNNWESSTSESSSVGHGDDEESDDEMKNSSFEDLEWDAGMMVEGQAEGGRYGKPFDEEATRQMRSTFKQHFLPESQQTSTTQPEVETSNTSELRSHPLYDTGTGSVQGKEEDELDVLDRGDFLDYGQGYGPQSSEYQAYVSAALATLRSTRYGRVLPLSADDDTDSLSVISETTEPDVTEADSDSTVKVSSDEDDDFEITQIMQPVPDESRPRAESMESVGSMGRILQSYDDLLEDNHTPDIIPSPTSEKDEKWLENNMEIPQNQTSTWKDKPWKSEDDSSHTSESSETESARGEAPGKLHRKLERMSTEDVVEMNEEPTEEKMNVKNPNWKLQKVDTLDLVEANILDESQPKLQKMDTIDLVESNSPQISRQISEEPIAAVASYSVHRGPPTGSSVELVPSLEHMCQSSQENDSPNPPKSLFSAMSMKAEQISKQSAVELMYPNISMDSISSVEEESHSPLSHDTKKPPPAETDSSHIINKSIDNSEDMDRSSPDLIYNTPHKKNTRPPQPFQSTPKPKLMRIDTIDLVEFNRPPNSPHSSGIPVSDLDDDFDTILETNKQYISDKELDDIMNTPVFHSEEEMVKTSPPAVKEEPTSITVANPVSEEPRTTNVNVVRSQSLKETSVIVRQKPRHASPTLSRTSLPASNETQLTSGDVAVDKSHTNSVQDLQKLFEPGNKPHVILVTPTGSPRSSRPSSERSERSISPSASPLLTSPQVVLVTPTRSPRSLSPSTELYCTPPATPTSPMFVSNSFVNPNQMEAELSPKSDKKSLDDVLLGSHDSAEEGSGEPNYWAAYRMEILNQTPNENIKKESRTIEKDDANEIMKQPEEYPDLKNTENDDKMESIISGKESPSIEKDDLEKITKEPEDYPHETKMEIDDKLESSISGKESPLIEKDDAKDINEEPEEYRGETHLEIDDKLESSISEKESSNISHSADNGEGEMAPDIEEGISIEAPDAGEPALIEDAITTENVSFTMSSEIPAPATDDTSTERPPIEQEGYQPQLEIKSNVTASPTDRLDKSVPLGEPTMVADTSTEVMTVNPSMDDTKPAEVTQTPPLEETESYRIYDEVVDVTKASSSVDDAPEGEVSVREYPVYENVRMEDEAYVPAQLIAQAEVKEEGVKDGSSSGEEAKSAMNESLPRTSSYEDVYLRSHDSTYTEDIEEQGIVLGDPTYSLNARRPLKPYLSHHDVAPPPPPPSPPRVSRDQVPRIVVSDESGRVAPGHGSEPSSCFERLVFVEEQFYPEARDIVAVEDEIVPQQAAKRVHAGYKSFGAGVGHSSDDDDDDEPSHYSSRSSSRERPWADPDSMGRAFHDTIDLDSEDDEDSDDELDGDDDDSSEVEGEENDDKELETGTSTDDDDESDLTSVSSRSSLSSAQQQQPHQQLVVFHASPRLPDVSGSSSERSQSEVEGEYDPDDSRDWEGDYSRIKSCRSFNSLDVYLDECSDTAEERAHPDKVEEDFALSLDLGPRQGESGVRTTPAAPARRAPRQRVRCGVAVGGISSAASSAQPQLPSVQDASAESSILSDTSSIADSDSHLNPSVDTSKLVLGATKITNNIGVDKLHDKHISILEGISELNTPGGLICEGDPDSLVVFKPVHVNPKVAVGNVTNANLDGINNNNADNTKLGGEGYAYAREQMSPNANKSTKGYSPGTTLLAIDIEEKSRSMSEPPTNPRLQPLRPTAGPGTEEHNAVLTNGRLAAPHTPDIAPDRASLGSAGDEFDGASVASSRAPSIAVTPSGSGTPSEDGRDRNSRTSQAIPEEDEDIDELFASHTSTMSQGSKNGSMISARSSASTNLLTPFSSPNHATDMLRPNHDHFGFDKNDLSDSDYFDVDESVSDSDYHDAFDSLDEPGYFVACVRPEHWTSRESIASVYSDAGEGSYGKIPITGDILFGLDYNYKSNTFQIQIKQCRDIAPVDTKRKRSDPYIKTYLLPDKSKTGKRKTRVKKHTLNPAFDEIIKYHMTKSELENRTLWLSVWHNDSFGRNDFLGEVNVPLDCYSFNDPTPMWHKLEERNAMPMSMLTYKGDLNVSLKYVAAGQVISSKKKGDGKGSRGELHVLIKQARNLTAVRANGTSDPFCKGYLLPEKGKQTKQKTQVKKRDCNPVWNHTYVFENIAIADLEQRSLELSIWDHDRFTSNDFLGGVRLNLGLGRSGTKDVEWMDAKGEEISLWQGMLDRPNCWIEGTLLLRPNLGQRK